MVRVLGSGPRVQTAGLQQTHCVMPPYCDDHVDLYG